MVHKPATISVDVVIARIAAGQHGAITTAQLVSCGLSRTAISKRVRAGRLHRIYHGVYAVGHHRLSNEGMWMAAVLACGKGAVLSHISAAALWRMLKPSHGPIHVTLPHTTGRNKRKGIRIHRSTVLLPSQTTSELNIPVTNPTRTLEDLRRSASPDLYRRARREAEFLRLPLGDHESDGAATELEERFLALCRRHRIPRPDVNVPIGPFIVDFLWRHERLIVEVDGWEGHGSKSAFEDDRARDARLTSLGYRVVRFTWRQLNDTPAEVAAMVQRLLAA
jgi:very-short-patch-repair endonuclease